MTRKFTAAFLLWMMSMTTIMAQPGLRYCLCADEIYLGDCRCPEPSSPAPNPPSCSCECDECGSSQPSASEHQVCAQPGGCSVDLFLNLEKYSLPSPSDVREKADASPGSSPCLHPDSLTPSIIFRNSNHDVRGPPPPDPTANSVPLFLRHSVFLL